MQTVSIGKFKAQFSEILERVKKGEQIVISYGKKREKVAVIIPYSATLHKKGRELGLLKERATCVIHDDFEITEEEMLNS